MIKCVQKYLAVNRANPNWGQKLTVPQVLSEIGSKRMVIFGEIHSKKYVVEFQRQIMDHMMSAKQEQGVLNIVFEHFSFEQQELLDKYTRSELDLTQLNAEYAKGTEGHDILAYESILEHAKTHQDKVRLHAGFIPRPYARMIMRESLEKAIAEASAKDYIESGETCTGSDDHYNFFEGMISGRDMHDETTPPGDNFRRMFPAQVIKDASMAYKTRKLLATDTASADSYLLLCGIGHMGYGFGVPERIFSKVEGIQSDTYMVCVREPDHKLSLDKEEPEDFTKDLTSVFGATKTPADLCYVFEEWEYDEEVAPAEEEKKEEAGQGEDVVGKTAAAYDKVGETAHNEGNLKRAYKVMKSIDYSDEEITIAGQDAYNFQGVNNPHNLAKIQPGEVVLDLGSGLGVDSMIAAERVGPSGKVTGLDISKKEVQHANRRAAARGLSERLDFVNADMEKMPFDDCSKDVVISNGAFCLAPNKERAFSEILRVLKPGGRFSVATSTMIAKVDQNDAKQWPICMRMFVAQEKLEPMCTELGFTDVYLDTSNSSMQIDLELEEDEELSKLSTERTQIHGSSKEFQHLANYDINAMCARVVIFGRKPL